MSSLLPVLGRSIVRVLVIAAGLAGYAAIIWSTAGDSNDPNIGAGLLAMALVVLASGVWGILDGRRHPIGEVAMCWTVVAAAYAAAWLVLLGAGVDGTMSRQEQVSMLAGFLPLQLGQVLAPALIGALIGRALRPTTPPS